MRGGGQQLARTTSDGDPIAYREWDVNPTTTGAQGAERLVTGTDGSAYYTDDHYKTFVSMRGAGG